MSKNKTQTKKEIAEKEKNKKLEVSLSFVDNMSQDIDDMKQVISVLTNAVHRLTEESKVNSQKMLKVADRLGL